MRGVLIAGFLFCAIAYSLLGANFWAWHVDVYHGHLASQELFPFFLVSLLLAFITGSAAWRRYHGIGSLLLFLSGLSVFLALHLPEL
jgi:hypothetical protein